jgi:hypothetical protein
MAPKNTSALAGHFERNKRPCDWRAARWLVVTGAAFIFYFSLGRNC